MSAKRITRVSLEDLDKMESLTDWERVDRLTDEEIAEAAANDPDTVHPDDPWWRRQLERGGVVVPPGVRKKRVTVPIDEDVLEWLRKGGRGWQHTVNHAVRRYMQDVERDRKEFEENKKDSAAE